MLMGHGGMLRKNDINGVIGFIKSDQILIEKLLQNFNVHNNNYEKSVSLLWGYGGMLPGSFETKKS